MCTACNLLGPDKVDLNPQGYGWEKRFGVILQVKSLKPLPHHNIMVLEGDMTARYAVALQQVSLVLFSAMTKPSMLIGLTLKTDYHG